MSMGSAFMPVSGCERKPDRAQPSISVSLPAHRRQKLENLCRYMLRPPLAVERLERLSSGRLAYRMKTPWRDGTTHVVMSDGELVEKLAALVPAPRFHLVRYFGILASAAKQRASIVPLPPPASTAESCGHRNAAEEQNPRARNYTWSQLMARVFDQPTDCMPRRGDIRSDPHYASISSAVRTGDRRRRATAAMG